MSSNLPFNAETVEVNKSEGPLKINIVAISTALLGYSDCYIKVFGHILGDHFGGALPLLFQSWGSSPQLPPPLHI